MHTVHIGKRLGNVSNHLRRYIDNRISEYGVTHMQSMIICFLIHRGDEPVYQKDIEREFGIRRSSVTTILQLMEKNGLITRCSDEKDARLKRIRLTSAGREADLRVRDTVNEVENELCRAITAEQKKELFLLLDTLEDRLTLLEKNERKEKTI